MQDINTALQWSPLVDLLKTKRWWIVTIQLFISTALGGIALAIPLPGLPQNHLDLYVAVGFQLDQARNIGCRVLLVGIG